GMCRMGTIFFAPFTRKLFENLNYSIGSFVMPFLSMTGFYLLYISKFSVSTNSTYILPAVTIICSLNGLYLAVMAVFQSKEQSLIYYFFLFYLSIITILLFMSEQTIY